MITSDEKESTPSGTHFLLNCSRVGEASLRRELSQPLGMVIRRIKRYTEQCDQRYQSDGRDREGHLHRGTFSGEVTSFLV